MSKSLHILADLRQCAGEDLYFTSVSAVRGKTLRIIKKAGFQIIASRFHKFANSSRGGEGGITGVTIVSESHTIIHTWPERKLVNIDIFFCNYSRNNTRKARRVFRFFKTLYQPKRTKLKEIWRD